MQMINISVRLDDTGGRKTSKALYKIYEYWIACSGSALFGQRSLRISYYSSTN